MSWSFRPGRTKTSKPVELARQTIRLPEIEADAVAIPDHIVNPVDLGTILVPAGWLLLGPGQTATLEIAALSRKRTTCPIAVEGVVQLGADASGRQPASPAAGERTRLTLKATRDPAGWRSRYPHRHSRRWRRPRALAQGDPGHARPRSAPPPALRCDLRAACGTMRRSRSASRARANSPACATKSGWKPELRDVVVWLPNGGRFVFWRGSSYIPFWAGLHNTAACYEWAEIISQPQGAVDCVEPLMDKELRYGRVEIVESTSARVHVRWSYQSTDFNYKVWGDEAVEDYYFYPDGFGTRVVNLKADPKNDYELSEFIILSPQGAYPFEVLPDDPVDALYLDGRIHRFRFPNPSSRPTRRFDSATRRPCRRSTVCASARMNQLSAIYFNPNETKLPAIVFRAFLRCAARWSLRVTGGATGRWRGATRRAGRSTTGSSSRRPTTA